MDSTLFKDAKNTFQQVLHTRVVEPYLKVDVDVESREYNGRWYTDVKAWRVEVVAPGTSPAPMPSNPGYSGTAPQAPAAMPASQQYNNNLPGTGEDDMPF